MIIILPPLIVRVDALLWIEFSFDRGAHGFLVMGGHWIWWDDPFGGELARLVGAPALFLDVIKIFFVRHKPLCIGKKDNFLRFTQLMQVVLDQFVGIIDILLTKLDIGQRRRGLIAPRIWLRNVCIAITGCRLHYVRSRQSPALWDLLRFYLRERAAQSQEKYPRISHFHAACWFVYSYSYLFTEITINNVQSSFIHPLLYSSIHSSFQNYRIACQLQQKDFYVNALLRQQSICSLASTLSNDVTNSF